MVPNLPCSDEVRNQVKVYDSRNNNKEIGLMKDFSLPVPANSKGTCYYGRWPNDQAELKSYFRFYGDFHWWITQHSDETLPANTDNDKLDQEQPQEWKKNWEGLREDKRINWQKSWESELKSGHDKEHLERLRTTGTTL